MGSFSRQSRSCLVLGVALAFAACHSADKTDVEMEVRSVGLDNGTQAPVVLLQDHDRKVALPIWIGPSEAQAIALQMQGISPPRPMTHDLIKSMLDQAGVEFQKVVIRDLKESIYYARIYLRSGHKDVEVDSRPSDAIALAVRFHRPIFVATALLNGDSSINLQHEAAVGTTAQVAGVTVQNLSDEMADYFSLPPGSGVIVADVASPTSGGLQRGDVILEVDGARVTGIGDFERKLQALHAGAEVRLSVQRGAARIEVPFTGKSG